MVLRTNHEGADHMTTDPREITLAEHRRRAAEWQAIYEAEQIIDAAVLELEYVDLTQTADHS